MDTFLLALAVFTGCSWFFRIGLPGYLSATADDLSLSHRRAWLVISYVGMAPAVALVLSPAL